MPPSWSDQSKPRMWCRQFVLRRLQRGSLGELADARSYLFRAVANEANSLRRRRRIEPLSTFDLAPPGADSEAVDMAQALLGLPVRQRAVVYLTYWMGFTTREVSGMLGTGTAQPSDTYISLEGKYERRQSGTDPNGTSRSRFRNK